MFKTILAVFGALFVAFILLAFGAGMAMSHDCSNKTSTQNGWQACMEDKANEVNNHNDYYYNN